MGGTLTHTRNTMEMYGWERIKGDKDVTKIKGECDWQAASTPTYFTSAEVPRAD
jgi:hypothetical protein